MALSKRHAITKVEYYKHIIESIIEKVMAKNQIRILKMSFTDVWEMFLVCCDAMKGEVEFSSLKTTRHEANAAVVKWGHNKFPQHPCRVLSLESSECHPDIKRTLHIQV